MSAHMGAYLKLKVRRADCRELAAWFARAGITARRAVSVGDCGFRGVDCGGGQIAVSSRRGLHGQAGSFRWGLRRSRRGLRRRADYDGVSGVLALWFAEVVGIAADLEVAASPCAHHSEADGLRRARGVVCAGGRFPSRRG